MSKQLDTGNDALAEAERKLASMKKFADTFADTMQQQAAQQPKVSNATQPARVNTKLLSLETVRIEERKRLSREIHDEMGQLVSALRMHVNTCKSLNQDIALDKTLDRMLFLIEMTQSSTKKIVGDLREEQSLNIDLQSQITQQLKEFSKNTRIQCDFTAGNTQNIELTDEAQNALSRVLQESLTNIMKHAKASKVNVHLNTDENGVITLIIQDNGIGFGIEDGDKAESFGLIGMSERMTALGGEFSRRNCAIGGAEIMVTLPCNDGQSKQTKKVHHFPKKSDQARV